MTTEPTICREPLDLWERALHEAADGSEHFRGLRVERNLVGVMLSWPGHVWPDENPWLGINPDGTRRVKGEAA